MTRAILQWAALPVYNLNGSEYGQIEQDRLLENVTKEGNGDTAQWAHFDLTDSNGVVAHLKMPRMYNDYSSKAGVPQWISVQIGAFLVVLLDSPIMPSANDNDTPLATAHPGDLLKYLEEVGTDGKYAKVQYKLPSGIWQDAFFNRWGVSVKQTTGVWYENLLLLDNATWADVPYADEPEPNPDPNPDPTPGGSTDVTKLTNAIVAAAKAFLAYPGR